MKSPSVKNTRSRPRLLLVGVAMLAMTLGMADPVLAQALEPVTRASTIIRDTVVGIALALMTVGICTAGYKIMFSGANFRDVSNLVIGGALCGGAAALAAVFITA